MSIEGGSGGGPGGGIGVSIGPAISAGVEAGLTTRFGPSISGPDSFASLPAVVNEGPAGFLGLENTMPYQIGMFNPIGSIRFSPTIGESGELPGEIFAVFDQAPRPRLGGVGDEEVPEVFQAGLSDINLDPTDLSAQAEMIVSEAQQNPLEVKNPLNATDVLAEANHWLGITDPVKREIVSEPKIIRRPMFVPLISGVLEYQQSQPVIAPVLGPVTDTENRPNVDTRTVLNAVSSQQLLEEQGIKEVLDRVIEEKTGMVETEKIEKSQRFYLVDNRALAKRIYEIRQAFKKAQVEAQRLGGSSKNILGKLIVKFMPLEHAGNRSEVIQPNGPDGSYEETKATIEVGQFSSEDQVETVILSNRPVAMGKDGEPVGEEEVKKVFKHRIVKPANKGIEIMWKRVMRKIQVSADQHPVISLLSQKSEVKEPSLKDLNLEEVFQKAA